MELIKWDDIKEKLPNARRIDEGFGGAQRHIIQLFDKEIFVKRSLDDATTKRIRKEIAVYNFLNEHGFVHAPALLSVAPDYTGFAIEALSEIDGWEWETPWTYERLDKTLEAMDSLFGLTTQAAKLSIFQVTTGDRIDDAWELESNSEHYEALNKRLLKNGIHKLADIDFSYIAAAASGFVFDTSSLIHNDVRRDNCAWKPSKEEVKLIDWDWAQLGDRSIDIGSLLVNVHKSGLDVTATYANRLNVPALCWLANYWFKSAGTPIWEGGKDSLRDLQLDSALIAYELALKIGS